jgi:2-iminoacetate synthase
MSAGSCTAPGGYASDDDSGQQFAIDDDRNVDQVAAMIRSQGYEPVWKDWDVAFVGGGREIGSDRSDRSVG